MDEVNGKFLKTACSCLGLFTALGLGVFGGRLLLAGQKSCWVASRRAVWATKDGAHLSATKGALGGGWDMETCWHTEHPHTKGLAKLWLDFIPINLAGFCCFPLRRKVGVLPHPQTSP